MTMAGCSDSLDDIRPKDQIPSDSLTENDLAKVLNGVYATMEDHVHNMWWDGDIKGENYRPGPGGQPVGSSRHVALHIGSKITLEQLLHIAQAGQLPDRKLRDQLQQRIGHSKAERRHGLLLPRTHILQRRYRLGQGSDTAQAHLRRRALGSAKPTYGHSSWRISTRPKSFCRRLPSGFYVSASACDALKARVYIAIGDKGKALTYADRVISSPAFSLAGNSTDWAKAFVSNSSSPELVFSLANKRTKNTILMHQNINDVDGSWNYSPATAIYSGLFANTAVKSGDIRAKATFNSDPTRTIKFANGMEGQFITNECRHRPRCRCCASPRCI